MKKRRSHFAPALSVVVESLESRMLLSRIAPEFDSTPLRQSAEVADAKTVKKPATETTLAVHAGTLGQPITFTVMMRTAAAAG